VTVANAGHILADGGVGYRIFQDSIHLHGALALILAPNGHLIVSNSDVMNGNPASTGGGGCGGRGMAVRAAPRQQPPLPTNARLHGSSPQAFTAQRFSSTGTVWPQITTMNTNAELLWGTRCWM